MQNLLLVILVFVLENVVLILETIVSVSNGQDCLVIDAAVPLTQGSLAVNDNLLRHFVAIVVLARLARSDGAVVEQLQKHLAKRGTEGNALAVLLDGVKLVVEGLLQLLTRNVGQLGLGDKRLGLRADKLLLQNQDAGRLRVLVLKNGNLVRDLLLAVARGYDGRFNVSDWNGVSKRNLKKKNSRT